MKAFRFIQPCQKLGIQNGDTIIQSPLFMVLIWTSASLCVRLQHTYTVFPGKLEIAFRHATTTHINPAANFLPGMQKSTWRYALVFWNDGWNIITHCVAWVREDKRYAHIMNRRCRLGTVCLANISKLINSKGMGFWIKLVEFCLPTLLWVRSYMRRGI